jgi:phosphoribosylamine--glycine ligase
MDVLNTVLIIGGGGREHAIAKALLRTDRALCLFAYPGNPGMEDDGCMMVDATFEDWNECADWAEENAVDLTIVGPEQPLVEGIVDIFTKRGLAIFGPSRSASRLEGSKEFSKNLMKKYKIPTADFISVSSKKDALAYLAEKGAPIVIKASGLAAGKGAVVCDTLEHARETLDDMFDKKVFGDAASIVVLEEKMDGEEASVFALTDGKSYKILPVAQDHKRAFDGDKGPNTGGMGAYAPAPCVDAAMLGRIEKEIIIPTLSAMQKEGATYKGLLYAGVMLTKDGPKVVEFNCRFGDPETQAVLPLVECDWYEVFMASARGNLSSVDFTVKSQACATVVCASGGYPGAYDKGILIHGLDSDDLRRSDIDVYHAGTARGPRGDIVTSGGRVLAVSAWAETLSDAVANAYVGVSAISYDKKMFRRDIAARGLTRINSH